MQPIRFQRTILSALVACLLVASLAAGCSLLPQPSPTAPAAGPAGGEGMGMGAGGGMMGRHHSQVPEAYRGRQSPAVAAEGISRGGQVYSTQCASCHGDGGMGDGPAGAALSPTPAPIAHTSQMMSDDYLFWRMAEGGTPFQTSMPAWKETLGEAEIWEVLAYVRALGAGQVTPQPALGGGTLQPGFEARQQELMLEEALAKGLIDKQAADNFRLVHAQLEAQMTLATPAPGVNMDDRQTAALSSLVAAGKLTQAQVDRFNDTHNKLAAP